MNITAPTPETVAQLFASEETIYDGGPGSWYPLIEANGNVVEITVTPGGEPVHFQAHVFQVDPEPQVAEEPVYLDSIDARNLAYTSVGKSRVGWTVVDRYDLEHSRWESHHFLVIRDQEGRHYGAHYSKGLTEHQDTRPWEGEKTTRFDPVTRHTRIVQIHSWIPAKAEGTDQ